MLNCVQRREGYVDAKLVGLAVPEETREAKTWASKTWPASSTIRTFGPTLCGIRFRSCDTQTFPTNREERDQVCGTYSFKRQTTVFLATTKYLPVVVHAIRSVSLRSLRRTFQ
jgi:hypothetical protein